MAVHNVSQTEIIRRRYNRTALFYDWMDKMISPRLRRQAIELAEGKVLEVGVGTGQNLPFYQGDCEVTGIDFSPGMLRKAQARLRLAKVPVKLLEMDAQAMSFADETFDTVVATCVFCSVPDPVQGLREIKRVCKKNGKIILLEHVRSDNPLLGWLMDLLNPVSLYLIGSNINRDTVQNVIAAGIHIEDVKNVKGKIVKLIIARP
ncbi:Methyltransferase type 11 [Thermosinus carboxydivorans Nor1]|uniref:Methyltransferase type 11 n=1 Tax=Thermosinus carboxydivorans Nor1 TaxID=401526 RepID=A1HR98_9FIRM|nr:class I SAM-dependent methyltransferase [Thermosinus carboxydivorans]EAX47414.1 Methyltransferase type 11 [Thermosinus carboxydivorans Nor1]